MPITLNNFIVTLLAETGRITKDLALEASQDAVLAEMIVYHELAHFTLQQRQKSDSHA